MECLVLSCEMGEFLGEFEGSGETEVERILMGESIEKIDSGFIHRVTRELHL